MTFPKLLLKEVPETFSQENFKRIEDYLRSQALDKCGFEFLELVLPSAVTNSEVRHHLGYVPKDVILMHNLNNVSVTFLYSSFTNTSLYITTSGATTLRLLVGRYE